MYSIFFYTLSLLSLFHLEAYSNIHFSTSFSL
nr:MAG TPA: hypothetical protein [Crassvirales sp.]